MTEAGIPRIASAGSSSAPTRRFYRRAEFFDIGQSRSVLWERREDASRLLAALKDPQRGWNAIVVGEGTRCWFGNQFSLIAPKFAAYGVDLWVPELGGKFDRATRRTRC